MKNSPSVADDQVLQRTMYLSLDPYMRGRLSDAESYATTFCRLQQGH